MTLSSIDNPSLFDTGSWDIWSNNSNPSIISPNAVYPLVLPLSTSYLFELSDKLKKYSVFPLFTSTPCAIAKVPLTLDNLDFY